LPRYILSFELQPWVQQRRRERVMSYAKCNKHFRFFALHYPLVVRPCGVRGLTALRRGKTPNPFILRSRPIASSLMWQCRGREDAKRHQKKATPTNHGLDHVGKRYKEGAEPYRIEKGVRPYMLPSKHSRAISKSSRKQCNRSRGRILMERGGFFWISIIALK
jgi:hypothetical protein